MKCDSFCRNYPSLSGLANLWNFAVLGNIISNPKRVEQVSGLDPTKIMIDNFFLHLHMINQANQWHGRMFQLNLFFFF